MQIEARAVTQHKDDRGQVFEVLRSEHVSEGAFGQVYVFTGVPGSVKGNHYHARKAEWFCLISGEGELVLFDRETEQRESITLTGDRPTVVTIPVGIAHAIRNLGDTEMVVLAYITEPFNPEDPDTIPFQLL